MVISGGQTGADQGGLMAAWDKGFLTGGRCPSEYRTNLGPNPILEVLGLVCTEARNYQVRTHENVELSDGTIIFGYNLTSPGSAQTRAECIKLGKPVFMFEFPMTASDVKLIALMEDAVEFIVKHHIEVLNVAGNRDTDGNMSNFKATRLAMSHILDLLRARYPDSK